MPYICGCVLNVVLKLWLIVFIWACYNGSHADQTITVTYSAIHMVEPTDNVLEQTYYWMSYLKWKSSAFDRI